MSDGRAGFQNGRNDSLFWHTYPVTLPQLLVFNTVVTALYQLGRIQRATSALWRRGRGASQVLEGECRLEQALIRDKRWRNLALMCISKNRQRYNVTADNMEQLTNMMGELGFHYILVDCPAGIDLGFVNAITSAKEAIVVTTPEITSIRDADRVAGACGRLPSL